MNVRAAAEWIAQQTPVYDRALMRAVMIRHQRLDAGPCNCGFNVLGASHADHILNVYEQAAGITQP